MFDEAGSTTAGVDEKVHKCCQVLFAINRTCQYKVRNMMLFHYYHYLCSKATFTLLSRLINLDLDIYSWIILLCTCSSLSTRKTTEHKFPGSFIVVKLILAVLNFI